MIFSENWLKEWVDPGVGTGELMQRLTMAGLEVDGSAPVAREFSGVEVAQITKVDSHPDADKLSVCEVQTGAAVQQVVCGAPNVRVGMKAPFASVGAEIKIPGEKQPLQIKAASIRGVESRGMLCSAAELGLEEQSDGLLELPEQAPVGEDLRSYLGLDDVSIELDLTPNRGDCLGLIGLAREVGVLAGNEVSEPALEAAPAGIDEEFPITISAGEACPRYLGRVIRNVNLGGRAPLWMREKLRRCGLRSIDPVVDVTNYVLLELGQPMHAFDYGKLAGHINVRMAEADEKITLLDGKEVSLTPDVLVIADQDKAVAMAGIMGGLQTAVSPDTEHVFLECAYFAPLAIAGRPRAYGMHTDASHRYERGVDYRIQHRAMERATSLLLEIVGGDAGPITEATGALPQQNQVSLRFAAVSAVLGVDLGEDEVVAILSRLGFGIIQQDESGLTLEVPSYRFDVAIEADLIEEIARIHGYNNIPARGGFGTQTLKARAESRIPLSRIRQQLVALGYQEVVTYAFIDPALARLLGAAAGDSVALQNPISEDMSVMRSSLLPGLLSVLQHNSNRQHANLRLFESGLVFSTDNGEISQSNRIAGLISGLKNEDNALYNNELCDFYDVKGDIECLLAMSAGTALSYSFEAGQGACFHPGQCAVVRAADGTELGTLGALHPSLARQLRLDMPVFLFEMELEAIQQGKLPAASPLSRYPEVSRDLAILVDQALPAAAILALIRENAGDFLIGLRIFDVYQGDAVTKGKKSVAIGLTWQHPSRTLSDKEINTIISKCVNALQKQFNANLRD